MTRSGTRDSPPDRAFGPSLGWSLEGSRPRELGRSLAWAAGYAAAMGVGGATRFTGEPLSIVWPACGVATLWLLGRRGRGLVLDLALLATVTLSLYLVVGQVNAGTAFWFTVGGVAQAYLGATLLRRFCPGLWGCGGTGTFDDVGRLYRLLTIAVVAALAAALVAALGLRWLIGQPEPMEFLIHWGRNVFGGLAMIALLHLVAHAWHFRDPRHPVLPRNRRGELVLLVLATVLVLGATFLQSGFPLAYLVAAVTIWAGLRFAPVIVALLVCAATAVALAATAAGLGPFAGVADTSVRGLLVQVLMTILIVEGLSLSAFRSHQRRLLEAVERTSRAATVQASLLSAIVDTIRPGLVVLDREGRPTRVNEPAATFLSMAPAVAEGDEPPAPDTDSWEALWQHLAAITAPRVHDLVLDGPEGRTVVEVSPTPMLEGAERTGSVVLLTDVTHDRARREGLTGFAGTVAHDLRGPLTGVQGWSTALADELHTDHADLGLATQMVDRVVSAASRMDDMIGDLLAHAVSRDSALTPATVSLDRIALEVAETLETSGRVVVHGAVDVHADETLVRHLVTNLMGNAVKYVPSDRSPRVELSARPDGNMVEVTVADNGLGIPRQERERVFEQFHRVHRDYPGTGLGLAIARTIVERHGGAIHAEPAPERGTRMVFTLPAPPHDAAPDPEVLRVGTQPRSADRERRPLSAAPPDPAA